MTKKLISKETFKLVTSKKGRGDCPGGVVA